MNNLKVSTCRTLLLSRQLADYWKCLPNFLMKEAVPPKIQEHQTSQGVYHLYTSGLVVFGFLAVSYSSGYLLVQLFIIVGCLMLSPAVLGKWEDCIIDRRRNQVTLTRCNWYHRVCCSVPEENTTIIPLNGVIGVRVSDKNLLELLMLSGKGVPITSHITDERRCSYLVQTVRSFLCLEHIEDVSEGYYSLDED